MLQRNEIPSPAEVRPAQPRTTAQVTLADGRIYEAPVWTPLEEYIIAAGASGPGPSRSSPR